MKRTLPLVGRRQFLRGTMNGAAMTLGLPLLDCFLNENGTAWASGARLPPCFAMWVQGNGLTPGLWEPKGDSKNYTLHELLKPLEPVKSKLTIFTGMTARLGGHSPKAHTMQVFTEGGITQDSDLASLDSLIADHISAKCRFRSLEANASGNTLSYSRRSASSINASEPSPLALYTRIFGPGYVDPNSADFKPDPEAMAHRSVLSYFGDSRQKLLNTVGAGDRTRLDEYFTSLRALENQLDQSLRKPDAMEGCVPAEKPPETPKGTLIETALENHKLFAQLLAHAFACGQTNVASLVFAEGGSNLRAANSTMTYHNYTHEEANDPQLGYQKTVAWFMAQGIGAYASFLHTLESMKEGPGTLLDRTGVLWVTDHGFAKHHTWSNIPVMIAGTAGGRVKSGQWIQAPNETLARVGLTLQRGFGMPVASWGTEANYSTQVFSELVG